MANEKLPYLTFKELREARGFATQQSLADACEISQAAVHKIETGVLTRLPHPSTLAKLLTALRVSEAQLTPILIFGRGLPSERRRKQEQKLQRIAEKQEVIKAFGRTEWEEWKQSNIARPTLWGMRKHTKLTREELAARAALPLPVQPTPEERQAIAAEKRLFSEGAEKVRVWHAAARQAVQVRRRGYARETTEPCGPTQEEMAARCGISLHAYQNIEKGMASPHESTIASLAKAFGVDSKYMRQLLIATKLAAEDRARRKARKKELGTLKEQAQRQAELDGHDEALVMLDRYEISRQRKLRRYRDKQFDLLGTDPR